MCESNEQVYERFMTVEEDVRGIFVERTGNVILSAR
jgi:hypothetical protein